MAATSAVIPTIRYYRDTGRIKLQEQYLRADVDLTGLYVTGQLPAVNWLILALHMLARPSLSPTDGRTMHNKSYFRI